MTLRGAAVLWLVTLVLACGPGSSAPDADPNAPDADPNAPDADPNAPDANPGAPDAAQASFPTCAFRCTTAADCNFGNPVNDADNYDCSGGFCVYRGCNSTQECVDTFMSAAYACGRVGAFTVDTCLQTCSTAANCATASAAFDADNYACSGGLCEYTGCNSGQECADAFGAGYGCHAFAGQSFASCVPRCDIAADCAIANGGTLYDSDNYQCDSGFCRWIGCNSGAECTDSLMNSGYDCR